MRQILSALCVFAIGVLLPFVATADSIFLDIRGITGETPTPGHPDALAAQSVTVVRDGFSAVRRVDSASPQIVNAVVTANVFPGATILFYNGTPAASPVATLPFQNVIATSYQLLSGGINPLEQNSFTSETHYSKFLELPGITGDASTPGHPGIICDPIVHTGRPAFLGCAAAGLRDTRHRVGRDHRKKLAECQHLFLRSGSHRHSRNHAHL